MVLCWKHQLLLREFFSKRGLGVTMTPMTELFTDAENYIEPIWLHPNAHESDWPGNHVFKASLHSPPLNPHVPFMFYVTLLSLAQSSSSRTVARLGPYSLPTRSDPGPEGDVETESFLSNSHICFLVKVRSC